jgi:hypothetical protein
MMVMVVVMMMMMMIAPLLPEMKELNKNLSPFLSTSQNCTKM